MEGLYRIANQPPAPFAGYNGPLDLRQIKPDELMEDQQVFGGYDFFTRKQKVIIKLLLA